MFENINLKYYSRTDLNNDGNYDYRAVLDNNDNWFVFAHLVPERRNLLEWYNFKLNSQIETSINNSKKVFKKALKPEGIKYLEDIVKYYNDVKSNFDNINIAESYMIADNVLCMEYIKRDSLKNILKNCIENNNIEKYKFYFNKYIELLKSCNIIEMDYSNLKEFENIFSNYYSDLNCYAMEYANIDLTFSNIVDKLEIESLNNQYISEIKAIKNNINKLALWIPIRKWRDNFRNKMLNTDQTRPDQTRPDLNM